MDAILETTYRRLETLPEKKNPVSVHLYGVLLFLSSLANELRTGIREKNRQAKAAFASDRNSTAGSNRKRGTCWDLLKATRQAKVGCRSNG